MGWLPAFPSWCRVVAARCADSPLLAKPGTLRRLARADHPTAAHRCRLGQGAGPTLLTLLSRRDRDRLDQRRWVFRMRQYEMMIIVDPEVDDRQVPAALERFLTVVKNDKGRCV